MNTNSGRVSLFFEKVSRSQSFKKLQNKFSTLLPNEICHQPLTMYDNKTPFPQEDCPLFNSKCIPISILYHIIDIGGLPVYLSCVQSCHLMYQLLSYRYSYIGQQCLLKIIMTEFQSNCKCVSFDMKNTEEEEKREQHLLSDMKELQNTYIYEILSNLCTKITSKHSNKQTIQQLIDFHKMDMRYFILDGDSEDDQSFVDSIKLFVDDDNRWNQGWIDIENDNSSVNNSIVNVSDIPPVIERQITIEMQSQKEEQFQQQMLFLESALTFYACVRYSIKYFHYWKAIVDGFNSKKKKNSKKKMLMVRANNFLIAWECLYLSLSPNKLRMLEHYLVYKARVHGLPVQHFSTVDMNPALDQCFRFEI